MKDNLLVFAIILFASLLFFSGCTDSKEKENLDRDDIGAEDASVVVRVWADEKIRLTLVSAGDNIPDFGYSLKDSVRILVNGEKLSDDNLTGNIGWEVNESLFIGGNPPVLEDIDEDVTGLEPGDYLVAVIILETLIFEDYVDIK